MRVPRSRGSQLYMGLLLGLAVGLGLVAFDAWRPGLVLIGVSFVVGGVARVVVPSDHTGMLRVRGKTFDVLWMTVLGVSLIVLASVVPPAA